MPKETMLSFTVCKKNQLGSVLQDTKRNFALLSPAFSKKSGGTLFLVFRGAWCVARGVWRVARGTWCVVRGSEFLVGTLSP